MVVKGLSKFILLGAAIVFCTPANGAIIYSTAQRSIQSSGTQLVEEIESTDTYGAYVNDMLVSGYVRDDSNSIVGSISASASQSSALTDTQIRGLGRGSGFGAGPGEATGESRMYVEFSITESMQFSLEGQLRLAPHGSGLSLNGSVAMVKLTGPNGTLLHAVMDEDNQPDHLGAIDFSGDNRLSGTFAAGDYILEAYSTGHGSEGMTRCVDYDFTLTVLDAVAVPEPGSATMLGTVLLSLLVIRRRRK